MHQGNYITLSYDQRDQFLSQDSNTRVGFLQKVVAEDARKVRDDIEETMLSEIRLRMIFSRTWAGGKSSSRRELLRKLDRHTYFGDYSDHSALSALIADCKSEATGLPLQSVSWTINSTDEQDVLSNRFHDFVTEAVLSNGYFGIGDVEISIQPISTSAHGFDAFNIKLTQSVSDQVESTYNG